MTLTQLRYVVAIDKHRSFAKAAESCLVAQPTLSLQIQKLERELGADVFDRTKNPIATTAIGEKIVAQAKIAIRESDKILEFSREAEGELIGTLSIGIIPTISTYLLPKIFQILQKKYSQVDFRIYELPTSQIIHKLEEEEIDVGILATPLQRKEFNESPLYYEPFVAYFPNGYKGSIKDLTMDALREYPMILLGEEHCFRHQSLEVCGRSDLGKIECGSLETIKKMVDTGAGMTLLPALSIEEKSPRVGYFAKPEPAREVSIVTRKEFFKKRILEVIKSTILETIPKEYHKLGERKMIGLDMPDAV